MKHLHLSWEEAVPVQIYLEMNKIYNVKDKRISGILVYKRFPRAMWTWISNCDTTIHIWN